MSMPLQTVLSTGPGFYAAATSQSDRTIPAGKVRFYMARIEAYEGDATPGGDAAETEFKLLPAMATDNPAVARALLQLRHNLNANAKLLIAEAKLGPS